MQQSANGRRFCYNAEGVRAHAYKCAAGKWTIGVGHKIATTAEYQLYVELGKALTLKEVDTIYNTDLATKVAAVNDALKHCPFKLNQNQFDALVAFVFNIGVGAWNGSTCRRDLEQGRMAAIPTEMRRWVHDDHGNVIEGLVNRREAEIHLFNTPVK